MRNTQSQVATLVLPKIHQLVHQQQKPLGVSIDQTQRAFQVRIHVHSLQDFFQW